MKISTIDFLVRLNNASYKKIGNISPVLCPYTTTNLQVARVLYDYGFIRSYCLAYSKIENRIKLKVYLKVKDGASRQLKIKIYSTPKKLVPVPYRGITTFKSYRGREFFFFTDKGLKNQTDCCREKIGGILAFSL